MIHWRYVLCWLTGIRRIFHVDSSITRLTRLTIRAFVWATRLPQEHCLDFAVDVTGHGLESGRVMLRTQKEEVVTHVRQHIGAYEVYDDMTLVVVKHQEEVLTPWYRYSAIF